MRDDVVEMSYAEMDDLRKALIAYEGTGAMNQRCPMGDLGKLLEETPVVRWEMGVAFFSMADILAVGNHPAVVSVHPELGRTPGMGSREPLIPLHLDGDVHRQYRRLIDPLFSPKRVAAWEGGFRELTNDAIDRFIDDGKVEFVEHFALPVPTRMFTQLFGASEADREFFIRCKDEILLTDGTTMEERDANGVEVGDRMRARLQELIDEKRAAGLTGDDLITTFIGWEVDGHRLSDDDILNLMHLFTIAGLDTVTSSISLIVGWLAHHPEERRRVIDDPSMIPTVVEELMRYESPVPSSGPRWATEDIDVNGVPVKAGEMIYLCWASANLDPAVFDDAQSVRFDREHNRHIGFAAGRHRCLGSHLARLELRVALDQWHRRVADYSIDPEGTPDYRFEGVRQAKVLPLVFDAR